MYSEFTRLFSPILADSPQFSAPPAHPSHYLVIHHRSSHTPWLSQPSSPTHIPQSFIRPGIKAVCMYSRRVHSTVTPSQLTMHKRILRTVHSMYRSQYTVQYTLHIALYTVHMLNHLFIFST